MTVNNIKPNQTEVELNNGDIVFVSYSTPVAAFISGRGIVKTSKKWSATTTKHINQFIQRTNPASTVSEEPQEFFDNILG